MSEEQKIKISEARKKLNWSPSIEQRTEHSNFITELWQDPEFKETQHKSRLKAWTPERRAVCSERMKKQWQESGRKENHAKIMHDWIKNNPGKLLHN
jgi:hypothetical protein